MIGACLYSTIYCLCWCLMVPNELTFVRSRCLIILIIDSHLTVKAGASAAVAIRFEASADALGRKRYLLWSRRLKAPYLPKKGVPFFLGMLFVYFWESIVSYHVVSISPYLWSHVCLVQMLIALCLWVRPTLLPPDKTAMLWGSPKQFSCRLELEDMKHMTKLLPFVGDDKLSRLNF